MRRDPLSGLPVDSVDCRKISIVGVAIVLWLRLTQSSEDVDTEQLFALVQNGLARFFPSDTDDCNFGRNYCKRANSHD
jgi:hypothetical protein